MCKTRLVIEFRCKISLIFVWIFYLRIVPTGQFSCPSRYGSYANVDRCDQYFSCRRGHSILRGCPAEELFDADRRRCAQSIRVNCAGRHLPASDSRDKIVIIGNRADDIKQELVELVSSLVSDENRCDDNSGGPTLTIYTGTTTEIVRITENVIQTSTKYVVPTVLATTTVWVR